MKVDARAIKASEEEFKKTNLAIVDQCFKDRTHIGVDDIIGMQYQFREDLWHYQFHTFEPNDKDRISTEMLLHSKLSDLTGTNVEKFRLQIEKIQAELGDNDPGCTVQEFIAFQIFFSCIDIVKAKMFRRPI